MKEWFLISVGRPVSAKMSAVAFAVMASAIVLLYTEAITQVWFLQLCGGYQVRSWLLALFLLIITLVDRPRTKPIPADKNYLLLSVYALFALIAMFFNESSWWLAIKYWLIMVAPAWLYIVIVENFRDNRDIGKMVKIIFFACFIFSVYTHCYDLYYRSNPDGITRAVTTNFGNMVQRSEAWFGVGKTEHSRGLMTVENSKYCGMLGPAILFGLFYFFCRKQKYRYIWMVPSFFMLYVCLNTLSRAGIITVFAGLAVLILCLFYYERSRRKEIGIFSFVMLLAGSWVIFKYQPNAFLRTIQLLNVFHLRRIDEYLARHDVLIFSGAAYADPHLVSVQASWQAFLAHPFLGSGFTAITTYPDEHNRYLFILASAGLLTFIPYVLFLLKTVWSSAKAVSVYARRTGMEFKYLYFLHACNFMFLVKLTNEGMETFFYWIFFALATAWIRNLAVDQGVRNG